MSGIISFKKHERRKEVRGQSWLIFGLFLLWSLVLTYPLVKHFETHIPRGTEPAGTVPLFNLWTLQWNIDQLMAGYSRYWNAPIFAPAQGTFAFSETQFLTGVLAAPIWLNFSPGAGYNVIVILFLTLNGWFAYHLLRLWQVKRGAALVSGLLCQGLPFVAQEMGVLQLTAIFSLLWNLLFLSRILRRSVVPDQQFVVPIGNAPWSIYISLGLGLPVTFLTCSYYGLFSLILMPLAFLCLASRNLLQIQTWLGLTLSMMIAFGLTYPFISTQQAILADYGFTRSEKSVRATSAKEAHYHQFLNHNVFYTLMLGWEAKGGLRLFPGVGTLTLACIGLMTWGRRRIRLYLLFILLLAYYLSLGFNWQIGDQLPYQLLRDHLPGFTQLRSPFRFALLVQLHLILLAGLGLDYLLRTPGFARTHVFASSIASCVLRLASSLTLVLLISFTLLESLCIPLPLQSIPAIQPLAAWQTWLKEQPDSPRLVFLPFAPTGKTADFEQTVHWMVSSRPLQAEILNGYSGFFPPWHQRLRRSMLAFPKLSSVAFLRNLEVDYVIVDYGRRSRGNAPQAPAIPKDHPWLRVVYEDEIEKVTILRVKK